MSTLPIFFTDQPVAENGLVTLQEDTSRHIVQVLRMKQGAQLQLTDGKGNLFTTAITAAHKRSTQVKILSSQHEGLPAPAITVAISLIKNAGRFEWFLEKATEIGVQEIFPLVCERTEKQHFRLERMHSILTSAMLQSRQVWLPRLHEPVAFTSYILKCRKPKKYIAHCLETDRRSLSAAATSREDTAVLIGPEGDFTPAEIGLALQHQFLPVTLGNTRLRTETAGMVAATLLMLC